MDAHSETVMLQGTISEIQALLLAKKVSCAEATAWFLARIDNHRALNAVRETNPWALDEARAADAAFAAGRVPGPLHGIPVLLKDNIFTAGMRTSAGCKALADFRPLHDASLVRKLRAAGAVILGKTNLTEFADYVSDVMPSEFSGAGGVVRNPHGTRYDRGQGSSVGSAAAVAASLAPLAIGSETQNSIQTPACYSSVIGFKPTVGLVSRAGVVPLVPSQDSPGPLARSVADAAVVANALAGGDPRDSWSLLFTRNARPGSIGIDSLKGVRIGVPRRQQADRAEFQGVMPLFQAAIEKLARAGAEIIDPCDLPSADQLQEVRSSVFRTEFKAALNTLLEDNGAPCGIGSIDALIAWNGEHPDAIPYGQSLLQAAQATNGYTDPAYIADRARDIALSLTGGIEAALDMHQVDLLIAPMGAASKCTGKSGAPVLALPAGMNGDTPFGITAYARPGEDARLLAIGEVMERALGGRVVPKPQA